ncbi:TMEM241 [Branchiostoma lanceolatum]|uniref:TMEM241 protein n=1 Tax=Branchiostoma lanceolatum TaxID=7740 RepID=A0A8J9Z914_BRALA|nr:TMEM241 [Branchiostoma lanceolatum]
MWRTTLIIYIFSASYITTTLCNKYVLSVLQFTLPTLFQGWQTFTAATTIFAAHCSGHLHISRLTPGGMVDWLPASLFFIGIIYAGSRALSHIPIPMFLLIRNCVESSIEISRWIVQRTLPSVQKLVGSLLTVSSAVALWHVDPQYDKEGYFWLVYHMVFLAGYKLYAEFKSTELSSMEKLWCNSIISVVLLAPGSVLLGHVQDAWEFPLLTHTHFHVAFLASGLLAACVGITRILVQEGTKFPDHISCTVKTLTILMSLMVFHVTLTAAAALCILTGIAGEVLQKIDVQDLSARLDLKYEERTRLSSHSMEISAET